MSALPDAPPPGPSGQKRPASAPPVDFAAALAARQGRYVAARALGRSIKAAAAAAGIGYRTARRYDDAPAARQHLLAHGLAAAERLCQLIEPQPYAAELWVQLRASLAVLDYVLGPPAGRRPG
jgi:hypothetical protein